MFTPESLETLQLAANISGAQARSEQHQARSVRFTGNFHGRVYFRGDYSGSWYRGEHNTDIFGQMLQGNIPLCNVYFTTN